MRHYELLVILKPTLTEEEKLSQVDFLKDLLSKNEASIEAIEDKGMRTLAYEIQKYKRAHYFVFYFTAPGNAISEVERMIRFNEDIIKFMTVKYENKKDVSFWETLANSVKNGNQKKDEKVKAQEEKKIEEKKVEETKETKEETTEEK
jgi:small subunit ribosomal protein S6